jgi:hypothetical protein
MLQKIYQKFVFMKKSKWPQKYPQSLGPFSLLDCDLILTFLT